MHLLKYVRKIDGVCYIILCLLATGQSILTSLTISNIIAVVEKRGSTSELVNILLVTLVLYALCFVALYWKDKLKNKIIEVINLQLKMEYIQAVLWSESEEEPEREDDLSFITQDLKLLETNYIDSILRIIEQVCLFLAAFVLSIYYDPLMMCVFMITSLLPALLPKFFGNYINELSQRWSKSNSHYLSYLKDTLIGIATVKIFSIESFFQGRLEKRLTAMEKSLKQMNNSVAFVNNLTITIAMMSVFVPILIGSYFVLEGRISLAILLGLVNISNQLVNPILGIIGQFTAMKTTQSIRHYYREVIDKLNNNSTLKRPESFAIPDSTIYLKQFSVMFNNQPIFQPITAKINKGEHIILTGPSGVGKTTLLKVLQGHHRQYKGQVAIVNQPLESMDSQQISQHVLTIQQEPFIFQESIKNNITLGRTVDSTRLDEVCRQVGLEGLIKEIGTDQVLQEGGKNLSGGQKQRIALARGLVNDVDILLLDEFNSALDKEARTQLYQLIDGLDITVIEISHHANEERIQYYDQHIELLPIVVEG